MNEQNSLNRERWDFSTHELHSYWQKSGVGWRVNMTQLHTPLGDAPSQSVTLLLFAPAFPTTCSYWWALPSTPTLFPLLQPFPLIRLLLLHCSLLFPSVLGSYLVHVGMCFLPWESSRISQEDGADRVFLSLPGLSHWIPVPVCTAALLCHVLWPPQRQREESAAGHRDIDPLQRPHLPDLNNRLFLANSTFYDWT